MLSTFKNVNLVDNFSRKTASLKSNILQTRFCSHSITAFFYECFSIHTSPPWRSRAWFHVCPNYTLSSLELKRGNCRRFLFWICSSSIAYTILLQCKLISNEYSVKYLYHVLANNNSVLYNLWKLTVILSKSTKVCPITLINIFHEVKGGDIYVRWRNVAKETNQEICCL